MEGLSKLRTPGRAAYWLQSHDVSSVVCHPLKPLNLTDHAFSCRCKAEFCYVCRTPWRNCRCQHVDEARLYERAQEVVDRDGEGNVAAVAAGLREHVECVNNAHGWVYRSGEGDCEVCGFWLKWYLYRCRGCQLLACKRCRYQRT